MRNNHRQQSILAALWVTLLSCSAFAAAPTAADMSRSLVLGSSVNIVLDGADDATFLWNLECIITQPPTNGSVAYQMPESYPSWSICVTYTPSNAPCTDTFKYKVMDEEGLWSGEATVTITVLANTAPQSYPLKAIVPANASVTRFLPYHDPDTAQLFTYRILSPPSSGIVTNFKSADTAWPPTAGQFTYVPNPGFTGEDSFTWNVTDGPATSSTQTARFLVRNLGDHANVSIDVIVKSLVLPDVQTEVDRLIADLQAEGYSAHITPWTQTSAEAVWNHLRAEYDGSNFLSGAILIGSVPVPLTDQGYKTDAIYWNMEKYNMPQPGLDAFRPSDRGEIWVSRMYAADSDTYGDEASLLKRALNANHDFRTGRSRYLDTARVYATSDFSSLTNNAESLTSVWTRVDKQVRNDFLTAWKQSGALLQSHSHGAVNSYQDVSSSSIHGTVAQVRFSLVNACSCGAFGGVANNQMLTRNGGNVITIAGSDIISGDPYIVTWTHSANIQFRERMALGECWGQSMLHALPLGAWSTENTIYYGDLSLGAHARDLATGLPFPENQLPVVTSLTADGMPAALGVPVTFTMSVTDSDTTAATSPYVDFKHRAEWYMDGWDYGRKNPDYVTDDTVNTNSKQIQYAHTYNTIGVHSIRALVMDEWQAVAWKETTLAVTEEATLAYDFFEGGVGSGGWNTGWINKTNMTIANDSANAYEGAYLMYVKNTGTATRGLDMTGVSGAMLRFHWKAANFDPGETAKIEVYDGAWHTVFTVNDGDDINAYQAAEIDISSFAMVSSFQLRVSIQCNADDERLYLDSLRVLSDGGGIIPPTCTLTTPGDGTTFVAPASILLRATASDVDVGGAIAKVEFFNGASRLGEDTTAPYEYTWSGVTAGSYALTARATDDDGAVTTSAVVNVTVTDDGSGAGMSATGGTVTNFVMNGTNYTAHIFTNSGTFVVTRGGTVEYLIVAGGGGGARGATTPVPAGGGGGGGFLSNVGTPLSIPVGTTNTVVVGAGGGGRTGSTGDGGNGGNSLFYGFTAIGGGGGNGAGTTANAGGSGGGGGGSSTTVGGTNNVAGQGFDGGASAGTSTWYGGGGGGAGASGVDGADLKGGNGGSGASSMITGSNVWYGGGGGGGASSLTGSVFGYGGTGGGGRGGKSGGTDPVAGVNGLGGGGGGGGGSGNGAGGGSGIVIVRYVTGGTPNPDADGDGVPDAWETQYFGGTSTTNGAPTADPDHDGLNNLQEYLAGTNPTNAASVLRMSQSEIRNPRFDPAQGFQQSEIVLRWQSASNKFYTLQAATNLLDGFTLILGSNIPATPPENVHTDRVDGVVSRFYGVKLETGN